MITETGKNLTILIATEIDQNWQTFATWYSVYKNLPEAKVVISCQRNGSTPFVCYQWAKRLKVPILYSNPVEDTETSLVWLMDIMVAANHGFDVNNILVIKPLVMAVDTFSEKLLKRFEEPSIFTENAWYLSNGDIKEMLNSHYLTDWRPTPANEEICIEAKESNELACLVSYQKGCGRWINTAKGCPFSSAGGLISEDMTANEHRVIELWKKMVSLYNAVA